MYYRIKEVVSRSPKKIFIMCGINDLGVNIPKDDSAHFFEEIIKSIEEALPDCEIYVQSILPCEKVNSWDIEQMNLEYKSIADEYGCTYIDLYPLYLDNDGKQKIEYYSIDHTHLNGEGYKVWIDTIDAFVN